MENFGSNQITTSCMTDVPRWDGETLIADSLRVKNLVKQDIG